MIHSIKLIRYFQRTARQVVCVAGIPMALAVLSPHTMATCQYVVDNDWGSGFVAKIRITNDTATAVNSWSVNWNYTGDNRVSSSWNTTLTGSNPYTATGISWNSTIQPGQSIEFGVQGKSSGIAEVPVLSGRLCGIIPTSASSSLAVSSTPAVSSAPASSKSSSSVSSNAPMTGMRRPLSPSQPMFMIHVDTWNAADPQKIIDLIPADLRPYTVFVISMSIFHEGAKGNQCNWLQVENGIETARSWVKTAAENGVWAMVQPSSGGFTHLPDYGPNADLESTIYGELFRNYPNFLGINYAEQFWGFDEDCSPSPQERWEHWANLLKLTNKYGGYLAVSFTGGFWGANINPLGMIKRNSIFENALKSYAKNFIILEKHTMPYGFHDIESVSMGMYLSGYAGHYGIRPDTTGWKNVDGSNTYPRAAGSMHLLEHLSFTGETVVDGPETIPLESVRNLSNSTTADGYTTRRWELYPHFKNIHMDIYRKILDGTLRILDRKEVIDRTKVVIVNDANSGDDRVKYSSPETLFNGLYLMDDDGTYLNQTSWYKKTGRYPAIPTVWKLNDSIANSFQVQVGIVSAC